MKTLYAWRNGAAHALTEEQRQRLIKQIAKGNANGAHLQLYFSEDNASFQISFSKKWSDRTLRTLALRLNAERLWWSRGDSEVIISDSNTPETLSEFNERHLAIAQTN